MNEREWLEAQDPQELLEFIGPKLSARKIRLFAAACCRTLEAELTFEQETALRKAEGYADGFVADEELRAALVKMLEHAHAIQGTDASNVVGHLTRAVHAALYLEASRDLYVASDATGRLPILTPYGPKAFEASFSYALYASINVAQAVAAYTGMDQSTSAQEVVVRRVFSSHANLLRGLVGNPFRSLRERIAGAAYKVPAIKSVLS